MKCPIPESCMRGMQSSRAFGTATKPSPTPGSTSRRTAVQSPRTSPAMSGKSTSSRAMRSPKEALAIVESMKMEFPVAAPCAGKVLQVFCREGSQVTAGQDLVVLEAA